MHAKDLVGEIAQPISKVAEAVLNDREPENGLHLFSLIGFRDGRLAGIYSYADYLANPVDEFCIVYHFRTKDCAIQDKSHHLYLNSSFAVADLNKKNWRDASSTNIRWRPDWMQHEPECLGYDMLNSLFKSF